MPNYFEAAESWFMKDYGAEFDEDAHFFDYLHGHQYGSGLSFGEQLYTARGTQGMAMMGLAEPLYMVSALHDQPDRIKNSKGTYTFRLIIEKELEVVEYLQRPIWLAEYAPGFKMPGKRGRRIVKFDSLINLPIYSKYSRLSFD